MKHQKKLLWTLGICFAVFVGVIVLFYQQIDPKAFHVWATKLAGGLVFTILVFFPLAGFPVSILFVVAGAKFGSVWGMAVVSAAIVLHLLLTYWLTTTFLHDAIARIFQRTKYKMPKIPEGEYVPVSLLTTLVPGVPYAAKNYMLVLAGVPFRIYLLVCMPAHIFHASLAIFFGDMTRDLTVGRTIFLISYAAVIIGLGRFVLKRLKARSARGPTPS